MPEPQRALQVEQRSIDYIPQAERHGSPRSLFTIWFAANTQVTTVVTGALAVILGLSLPWAIVAIVVSNLLGAIFMALHSAQGPAYFLIPWTSINLVDFYAVRKERYSIRDIFDPTGIYGSVSWRALGACLIAILVEVPFMSASFYTGPLVSHLGGADISWILGIIVASVLYYQFMRPVNLPEVDDQDLPADASPAPVE